MKQHKLNRAMRVFFLGASAVIWTGIFLTGFRTVHWFLYVPAIFFLFAAITGICPGMIVTEKLFGREPRDG